MGRTERGARGSFADAPPIEFLAPRRELFDARVEAGGDDALGAQDAFSDADDQRSPRTTTVVAGIALLGLIVAGVVAAAPWRSDAPSTAPVTTPPATAAPAPTTPASTSPPPPGAVSAQVVAAVDLDAPTDGYLLDPVLLPDPWRAVGGLSPTTTEARRLAAGEDNGWLELWATPAASRNQGAWFAVQYTPDPMPFAVQDAARVAVDGGVGFLTTTSDGVSALTFPAGRASATITWSGWNLAAIVEIADTVRFARSGRPRYGVDAFQRDHVRLLSRSSFGRSLAEDLFMTDVVSTAHYRDTSGSGVPRQIDVTTRVADAELDGVLARFVISSSGVLGDGATTFLPVGAGAISSGHLHYPGASAPPELHVLQWTVDGTTIHLTTTVPIATAFDEVPLGMISAGTVGAWQRQQLGAGSSLLPARTTVDLGSGVLDDGTTWQVDVAPEVGWASAFVTTPDGTRGFDVQLDLGFRPCGTAAMTTGAVVVCLRPAKLGAASLSVDAAWGSIDVPFRPIGDDGWVAVIHRFDGVGGFRASIIGPNGSTTPALAVGDTA